jgi:A/G-specific adenine glycosylase
VLVSEVMLQQTQALRVVASYRAFLRRFPSMRALSAASRRDVLIAWDGLGYNRRAVALSEAARMVEREHGGRLPRDVAALQRLPGVGPYTAAAVGSIAFGTAIAAIDTNVRRIVTRVFVGDEVGAVAPARVRELSEMWLDRADPGGWNQALMDLGREVCRPRPRCDVCPLVRACRFASTGATPEPTARRQAAFEGSFRQVRGGVVRALRTRRSSTVAGLAETTGHEIGRVAEAVERLAADGIVERSRGRVRLAP